MNQETDLVVEGFYWKEEEYLRYEGTSLWIPENALALDNGKEQEKLILYAYIIGFPEGYWGISYNQNLPRHIRGGWPILDLRPNFDMIHDVQRSIITRDGRLFLKRDLLERDKQYYLHSLTQIIYDSMDIIQGGNIQDINRCQRRVF
ncbi:hypothetical protein GF386_06525 [Candidatus Pacearchaeota archaeon]|nr:hypothetical protein [Candidatus Pacearchaeota archaeon]MBD3283747.1 hypothetical protein [Candidatus Pacearchaeota archaeon]